MDHEPPPTLPRSWKIDERMLESVPRALFSIVLDTKRADRDRVRAAKCLADMNAQNAAIEAAAARDARAADTPALRLDLSADGVELLRTAFLTRLDPPGGAGRAGRPADTDRSERPAVVADNRPHARPGG